MAHKSLASGNTQQMFVKKNPKISNILYAWPLTSAISIASTFGTTIPKCTYQTVNNFNLLFPKINAVTLWNDFHLCKLEKLFLILCKGKTAMICHLFYILVLMHSIDVTPAISTVFPIYRIMLSISIGSISNIKNPILIKTYQNTHPLLYHKVYSIDSLFFVFVCAQIYIGE